MCVYIYICRERERDVDWTGAQGGETRHPTLLDACLPLLTLIDLGWFWLIWTRCGLAPHLILTFPPRPRSALEVPIVKLYVNSTIAVIIDMFIITTNYHYVIISL